MTERVTLPLPKPKRTRTKGVDLLETAARKFRNRKSVVMDDKREILFGLDWQRRKKEVEDRDAFMCRRIVNPDAAVKRICGAPAEHIHHIIARSVSRNDAASNLMCVCANCHRILHPRQQTRFGKP